MFAAQLACADCVVMNKLDVYLKEKRNEYLGTIDDNAKKQKLAADDDVSITLELAQVHFVVCRFFVFI